MLTRDFEGLVIKIEIEGIEVIEEKDNYVIIRIGAGENWHRIVLHCLEKDWGGVENLSLIPGTVGAAPMQNIGAYGVEIKEVFESLDAFNVETGEFKKFSREDCDFGYRFSAFKGPLKNQYIITSVSLKLTTKEHHLNASYRSLADKVKGLAKDELSINMISNAVIDIRQSKLPDPKEIGNAGSFFKNPIVEKTKHDQIKSEFPNLPSFPVDENSVKIPAAWLIETCGWKGFRDDDVGVHKDQALVLVNYGSGKGEMIKDLSEKIRRSVKDKFDIELQPEVNII